MSDPLAIINEWKELLVRATFPIARKTFTKVFRLTRRKKLADAPTLAQIFLKEVRVSGYTEVPTDTAKSAGAEATDLCATQYLKREGHTLAEGELPTYHFFIRKDVVVKEFFGCLIPPLDSGHGQENSTGKLQVSGHWKKYLQELGLKTKEKDGLRGRRIIFFDKDLLIWFIRDHEWILHTAGDPTVPYERREVARIARDYAYDVITMHKIMRPYNPKIECRYVSKSKVASADYYDFGCYRVGESDIVYQPIYRKGRRKTICEERVSIDLLPGCVSVIADHRRVFEKLWAEPFDEYILDDTMKHAKSASYYDSAAYREFDLLTFAFFAAGYFTKLESIVDSHASKDSAE